MTRRYDLDWLRIGAFALLIGYHVGMLYVPWAVHVKSAYGLRKLQWCRQRAADTRRAARRGAYFIWYNCVTVIDGR